MAFDDQDGTVYYPDNLGQNMSPDDYCKLIEQRDKKKLDQQESRQKHELESIRAKQEPQMLSMFFNLMYEMGKLANDKVKQELDHNLEMERAKKDAANAEKSKEQVRANAEKNAAAGTKLRIEEAAQAQRIKQESINWCFGSLLLTFSILPCPCKLIASIDLQYII